MGKLSAFLRREPFLKLADLLATPYWPLGVAAGMMVFFAPHPEWHGDLFAFRTNPYGLWHPYWARWLFELMAVPAEIVAYITLSLISIAVLFASTLIFGGKTWKVFLSFPFAWTLFYGQIDSLAIAGVALALWALDHEKHYLVGVGFVLAWIKPQLTLPLTIAILWWSPARLKAFVFPVLVLLATFLRWGFWIPDWVAFLDTTDILTSLSRNMSSWPVIGPAVLFIWVLTILTHLPRERKILLIAAATSIAMPYYPLPSFILHLSMPLPLWAWAVVQLPAIGMLVGIDVYDVSKLIPIALFLWAAWPSITGTSLARKLISSRK